MKAAPGSRPALRRRSPSRAARELVNTQTATMSSTLNAIRSTGCRGDAQRAERGDVPAGRQHGDAPTATRTSTACRSRSSAITLDGVSNNDNFNKSTDGFFALGDAAAGRGRGGHGDDRGRRRRRRRQRRGRDQLRHPLGHEPLQRQRLRVLPRIRAEHELLVQQAQRPAEERRQAQSVRRRVRAARS